MFGNLSLHGRRRCRRREKLQALSCCCSLGLNEEVPVADRPNNRDGTRGAVCTLVTAVTAAQADTPKQPPRGP